MPGDEFLCLPDQQVHALGKVLKPAPDKFAHRVDVDFTSDSVKPLVYRLHSKFRENTQKLIDGGFIKGSAKSFDEMLEYFENVPEAGAGLLLSIFTTYQAYFHLLHTHIDRVVLVVRKEK